MSFFCNPPSPGQQLLIRISKYRQKFHICHSKTAKYCIPGDLCKGIHQSDTLSKNGAIANHQNPICNKWLIDFTFFT